MSSNADPVALPDYVTIRLVLPDGTPSPLESVSTVKKSDAEWRELLGGEAYAILRSAATERPFCGVLLSNKKEGIYFCAGCELPLFNSLKKYDSGSGWPSFYEPFAAENIAEREDRSHGMLRTEINCARCGGHLGHVFPDGPAPTGQRYCLNSAAMTFRSFDEIKDTN